jgi:pimeloyl-ACP methyl ester carboxylesterase
MRRLLIGLGSTAMLVVVAAMAYGAWRNPEKQTLDEAARAGAPGQFIALSSGMTHYELTGPDTGRTVVLVHGFSVPYYIWDSTSAGLTRAGYRVLRYDMFGRGYSDRPAVDYDAALYDDQLRSLLDSLRITEPIDLVGLSFGGFVTAHFVTTHTARVRTLTLVDPISDRIDLGVARFAVIGPWIWRALVAPGMAENQLTDFLHPERHPRWAEQYRPQMRYKGFGHALRSTAIHLTDADFDTLYAGVARSGVPVLLIWGMQDQTIPFAMSDVVRRNIPAVEFMPVDSAGHLPHIEQAQSVNARLEAFFEAHPAIIRDRT